MAQELTLIIFHVHGASDDDESLDALVKRVYDWGALHVQPMSTVGPSGGDRFTILAEIPADQEWQFARNLASTLGVARYHRMGSTHCYQPVTVAERPIVAKHGDDQVGMTVRFHLIGVEREPLYVQVVDDDLQALRHRVRESCAVDLTENELQRRLQSLLSAETGFVLDLAAGNGSAG